MARTIEVKRHVSAKEVRMLELLQQELAIATNRYEGRGWDADAHKLKVEKVLARMRLRSFWYAIIGNS